MRTIRDIYIHYEIPDNLQTHQIRVAAVGKYLANALLISDYDAIIQACLLHDMGNIIKFKFDGNIPLDNEEHLKAVQKRFIQKYGDNEHHATDMICREIGVRERVLELVNDVSSRYGKAILEGTDIAKKIRWYSDNRVLPHKIGTLEERYEDLDVRYKDIKDNMEAIERHKIRYIQIKEIEKQLFSTLDITPDMLTDSYLEASINDLWEYEIGYNIQ